MGELPSSFLSFNVPVNFDTSVEYFALDYRSFDNGTIRTTLL
jgi:hypothetical protein